MNGLISHMILIIDLSDEEKNVIQSIILTINELNYL